MRFGAILASVLSFMMTPVWADEGGIVDRVRLGLLWHDAPILADDKEDGVDFNAEIQFVSPEILSLIWAPRPHFGFAINSAGQTDRFYAGGTWDWDLSEAVFLEAFLGAAYHDGHLRQSADPDRKLFGCRILIRGGAEIGYRFGKGNSVSVMYDHMSNADLCDKNEGADTIGFRFGYQF
jgi:hypothetical protein